VRRDAGSAADITGLYVVPGSSGARRQANDLIVRGAVPGERFYLEQHLMPTSTLPPAGGVGRQRLHAEHGLHRERPSLHGGFGLLREQALMVFDISYRRATRRVPTDLVHPRRSCSGQMRRAGVAWMFSPSQFPQPHPSSWIRTITGGLYDLQASDYRPRRREAVSWSAGAAYDYDHDTRGDVLLRAGLNWRTSGATGYSDRRVMSFPLDARERIRRATGVHEPVRLLEQGLTFRTSITCGSRRHNVEFGVEAQNVRFRNWDDLTTP